MTSMKVSELVSDTELCFLTGPPGSRICIRFSHENSASVKAAELRAKLQAPAAWCGGTVLATQEANAGGSQVRA